MKKIILCLLDLRPLSVGLANLQPALLSPHPLCLQRHQFDNNRRHHLKTSVEPPRKSAVNERTVRGFFTIYICVVRAAATNPLID